MIKKVLTLVFGLFFGVVLFIPLALFIHQIGHAIPALLLTSNDITITLLGESNFIYEYNLLDRIMIKVSENYIPWSSMCEWGSGLGKWQELVAYALGPIFSLITAFVSYLFIMKLKVIDLIKVSVSLCFYFSFFQFLFSLMPVEYPSWMELSKKE